MLFTSPVFLFVFLPSLVAFYSITPREFKNFLLLLASLLFYAWGEPIYVLLLISSIVLNFIFGLGVGSEKILSRKIFLGFGLSANIALLCWFKYIDFFIDVVNSLVATDMGMTLVRPGIMLPLGISFFTFQGMSYLFDVFRGEEPSEKNIFNVALYISSFPQLIAGPIVRYHAIAKQISNREHTQDKFVEGTARFLIGLAKKLVIANTLGEVASQVFGMPADQLTALLAWIGVVCYALQIYFDFSAYSDMAIGLGLIFGFRFPENFNYPYKSLSIREFWRRWHITLSLWFRDYLYIPLGGSRHGYGRRIINLYVVFILCGLWHGASWNFVVWGLIHGSFMVLEGAVKIPWRVPKFFRLLYVWLVVLIAWVFFRSETLAQATLYISAMMGGSSGLDADYMLALVWDNEAWISLVLGVVLMFPVYPWMASKVIYFSDRSTLVYAVSVLVFWVPLFVVCMSYVAAGTYNPFIYFRF